MPAPCYASDGGNQRYQPERVLPQRDSSHVLDRTLPIPTRQEAPLRMIIHARVCMYADTTRGTTVSAAEWCVFFSVYGLACGSKNPPVAPGATGVIKRPEQDG